MNTNNLTVAAASLLLTFVLASGAATPIHETADARVVIALQAKSFTDALARGDARAAAAMFTADAKLMVSGSPGVIAGRGAIEGFWRSALSSGVGGLRLTTVDLEGGDSLQIETGTYQVLGAGGSDLGNGHYLFVWKKDSGVWRIHRDIGVTRPAQAVDRVGFPRGYASGLKLLDVAVKDPEPSVMTTFANQIALSVAAGPDQVRYPYGTVIAMEFAHGVRDGEGQLLYDPGGKVRKAEVARIDVMRREPGYGTVYGENRAGEWEFASYRPDGTTLVAPENAAACAECHRKAGPGRDFVYRRQAPAAR